MQDIIESCWIENGMRRMVKRQLQSQSHPSARKKNKKKRAPLTAQYSMGLCLPRLRLARLIIINLQRRLKSREIDKKEHNTWRVPCLRQLLQLELELPVLQAALASQLSQVIELLHYKQTGHKVVEPPTA